jgi:hypothetical protein
VNAPVIEFAQAGRRGAIRFRREWIDDFIDGQRNAAPAKPTNTTTQAKSSHGLHYDLLGR